MNQKTSKILSVVRREFVARVHTKSFIITTILMPLLMALGIAAMILLTSFNSPDQTTRIAVVDGTSIELGQQVQKALAGETMGKGTEAKPRYRVDLVPAVGDVDVERKKLVAQTGFSHDSDHGKYDGVLVLPAGALAHGKVTYYGANASSLKSMGQLRGSLSKAFSGTRLTRDGLDVKLVTRAMRPVHMDATKVSSGNATGQSGISAFFVAYAMGFLLYLLILIYGQNTLTSVIEEKTSRVVEVLVSSLTPFQMLLGKVVGVGGAGLLQMAIWAVFALLITSNVVALATLFGVAPAAAAALSVPHIGAGLIIVFLLYFALGFLLYGALYAAIGSMCNAIQESQQYATIVTILVAVGFFAAFGVIQNPNGTLGQVLSWIPFFAPFVMPVRWSLTAIPAWELVGSLAMMVVGILFCVWVAARIYQVGILMFGKKPSWRELWRWVRAG